MNKKEIANLRKGIGKIIKEVINLSDIEQIFYEIVAITEKNPKVSKNNSYWDFFKKIYISSMVLEICRQVDKDERSLSLINFLIQLRNDSFGINQSDFLKQYSNKKHAVQIWKDSFENKKCVDCAMVILDIKKLESNTGKIYKFRNKKIAHKDKNNRLRFSLTFNDLKKAVKSIQNITEKYAWLFNVSNLPSSFYSTFADNWEEIFTIPWINKNKI